MTPSVNARKDSANFFSARLPLLFVSRFRRTLATAEPNGHQQRSGDESNRGGKEKSRGLRHRYSREKEVNFDFRRVPQCQHEQQNDRRKKQTELNFLPHLNAPKSLEIEPLATEDTIARPPNLTPNLTPS